MATCSPAISVRIRQVVPKVRCGLRNQRGRTPSSATRFSTPLAPTIDVLTAPARIRDPTPTTRVLSASLAHRGPTTCIASPEIRLSWKSGRARSGMIMTAKKLIRPVRAML